MSCKIVVRGYENIESVINRFHRACSNADLPGELKKRQCYVKKSALRHIKNCEQVRKRKYQKKKEMLIAKFGIDSVPAIKKRRKYDI